jgi:hypothetical protein
MDDITSRIRAYAGEARRAGQQAPATQEIRA